MTPPSIKRRESPQPSERNSQNNSDGESGEKPVREKLRETSIAGQTKEEEATPALANGPAVTDRGGLRRKRSIEAVESADNHEAAVGSERHVRKRSREATPGFDVAAPTASVVEAQMKDAPAEQANSSWLNGSGGRRSATPDGENDPLDEEQLKSGMTSPKNKRTRDQVLQDEKASAKSGEAIPVAVVLKEEMRLGSKVADLDERRTKRSRDSGSPQASGITDDDKPQPSATKVTQTISITAALAKQVPQISPSSGFANTSTASPFSTSNSKSPPPQTSATAFASSGFGSFAKSTSSFGGALSGSKSPFGGSSTTGNPTSVFSSTGSAFGSLKDTPSSFGTASKDSGLSTFGSNFSMKPSATTGSSGFGGLGSTSAFGGGFGSHAGGSKLSSFAGGSGPKIEGLSSKPAAQFGAATADDSDEEKYEGSEEEENATKGPRDDEVKKDKRFYEQAVETGEENETTVFLQRAKLYSFSVVAPSTEKKWVERGVGNLKLNVTNALPPESETEATTSPTDKFNGDKPKQKARFVMRAEGSHRVVLNSPVQKGSKFGEETGDKPKGQKFYFLGRPEGSETLETMILKVFMLLRFCHLRLRSVRHRTNLYSVESGKCYYAVGSSA